MKKREKDFNIVKNMKRKKEYKNYFKESTIFKASSMTFHISKY